MVSRVWGVNNSPNEQGQVVRVKRATIRTVCWTSPVPGDIFFMKIPF